jgi:hypothetical protein
MGAMFVHNLIGLLPMEKYEDKNRLRTTFKLVHVIQCEYVQL